LEGHALGNLFLAALTATTGDFVEAVRVMSELLGTVGAVLPAAIAPVELVADCDGVTVVGQAKIMASRHITNVRLRPEDTPAPTLAINAIKAADQIVVGPGSLYTSVLAALAPLGIEEAIASSHARLVYVANLREQIPETAGYDVASHIEALCAHGLRPDVVLADSTEIPLGELSSDLVVLDTKLTSVRPLMHDEQLLGAALSQLL
jgi:uncharacterized cofD-like protein